MLILRRAPKPRAIALALFALLGVGIGLIYFALVGDLPPADALITRSSPDTTKIFDRKGRLLFEILDPRSGRRTRVPLNELPLNLQHAVLAVEDANFYQNPGVDLVGIARAAWQNLSAGEIVAGGSTITQQLARDLLLSKDESTSRTITRKLREMVLAVRLTRTFSKDKILEMYLNEAYFGQLAYGAEAASRTYFGKPARDLDLAESALLAGLIQSPAAYNPLVNWDAARARQQVVLDLMVKHGFLPEDQARLAFSEPLHLVGQAPENLGNASTFQAPHFVSYVRNLLEAQYGAEVVNHGGLRVVTTLDLDLQHEAEAVVKYNIGELSRRTREEGAPDHNLHDAALVAIKPDTGEILALVGSADYFDASIDGAVDVALANRQPGSAIKPITYATAFARDYTPATVISDVPTSFLTKENEPYEPLNYDQTWHGPISLRTALATSSNMVAVKVLDHVGIDSMIKTAQALGISTFNDSDRFGLSLTLGGGEVKLLELTAAYAAFANGGQRVEPKAILSVTTDGSAIQSSEFVIHNSQSAFGNSAFSLPPSAFAVSPQVAYLVTNILSDDGARIPAFGEDSVLNLSRPAAVKTGTTTDFRDNWTVGYTPDLAVGVWAGNADNEPMYKISGITGAAPIWHDFIEEALQGTAPREFSQPDGIVEAQVCETSGLLPTQICPRLRTEVFIKGSEPTRSDTSYEQVAIDSASGMLWTNGCQGQPTERVYRIFPPDAQDWARKQGFAQPPEMDCMMQVPSSTFQVSSKNATSDGQPSTFNPQPATSNLQLVLTSPAPNSIFQLSPQIPMSLQQVEVSARLGSPPLGKGGIEGGRAGVRSVTLFVDGKPVGQFASPPYRALWQLVVGDHQAQAVGVDASGNPIESPLIHFVVTNEQ